MRCGRNLLRTFLEYYHVTGAVPVPPTVDIKQKRRRPNTHRSRSATRHLNSNRPNTTRPKALLHFKDLTINYDSETSIDEPYSFRHPFSPRKLDKYSKRDSVLHVKFLKKIGQDGLMTKRSAYVSPPPTTYVALPQPSLSIIDFNTITRGAFDKYRHRSK